MAGPLAASRPARAACARALGQARAPLGGNLRAAPLAARPPVPRHDAAATTNGRSCTDSARRSPHRQTKSASAECWRPPPGSRDPPLILGSIAEHSTNCYTDWDSVDLSPTEGTRGSCAEAPSACQAGHKLFVKEESMNQWSAGVQTRAERSKTPALSSALSCRLTVGAARTAQRQPEVQSAAFACGPRL